MVPGHDRAGARRSFLRASGAAVTAGVLGGALAPVGPAAGGPRVPAAVGVLNVRAFGAKGDGAADDTAALQAALDAAWAASGGLVFLPPGAYKTMAGLTCRAHHVAVCGVGGASVVRPVGAFDTLQFAG